MKYKILLKVLTTLIYFKRFLWWSGSRFGSAFIKIFNPLLKVGGYFFYRLGYYVEKRVGLDTGLNRQVFKRDNLQILVLFLLFFLAIPQTKIYGKTEKNLSGKNTI